MKTKSARKIPEIPFSRLLSEKILPFTGTAALSGDEQAYEDGISLLSEEMVVLFANRQAQDLLSSQGENLVGKQLDIPGLAVHSSLLHAVSIEQSEHVIELRTNPITVRGEKFILLVLQDITRQFENIQRLNFAIDATELGLWDYNFITNSTSINPYYATMLGYTFEEFESGNWVNMVHPIDLKEVWKSWYRHIDGQIPYFQAAYRIQTKNNRWKWILARGQIKDRNTAGEPLHYIGSHQDITGQKQAQRELQLQYRVNVLSGERISLENKLEKMLNSILPILLADRCMLHLNDPQDTRVLSASAGLSLMEIYAVEQLSPGILDGVKSRRRVLSLEKAGGMRKKFLRAASAELAVIYPLAVQSRMMGTLTLFWTAPQPFTDLDDHIAHVAANQLAAAIEREYLQQTADLAVLIEERQRLARELHDSLSQSLYSVLLSADGGQDFARQGNLEQTEEIFAGIKETMQQALREMRLIVYELQPSILAREGLHQALEHRLESVEKRAGLSTCLEDTLTSLPAAEVEAQLFGIAHEALNNILKHAGARTVHISLHEKNRHILMRIVDDGIGFDSSDTANRGFGLSNMKERTRQVGGEFRIHSKAGEGTEIIVLIPMQE